MLIQVRNLAKSYRGRRVVDDVTFDARPGTTTVLAGPNGAGKSTVFSVMTAIASGDGTTTYDGVPWPKLDSPRRTVGVYVGASPFHNGARVRDHLGLLAAVGGVGKKRIAEVLEQFHLGPHRDSKVASLSLGMKQRLGLASAILTDPPALLLDEPFNALDPTEADTVYAWLAELTHQGRTIVLSTHHLDRIEPYATHVLFMSEGRLVASGTPSEIAAAHHLAPVLHVVTDQPGQLADALTQAGVRALAISERLVRVQQMDQDDVEEVAARCGVRITAAWHSQPSLPEMYAALI